MTSSQSLETPPLSRYLYWGTFTGKNRTHLRSTGEDTEHSADSPVSLSLSLSLSSKTDRVAKGAECFQRSLTLNPFLWSPFQNLCHLGNAHILLWSHEHCQTSITLDALCSRRETRPRSGVQVVLTTELLHCPASTICKPCPELLP